MKTTMLAMSTGSNHAYWRQEHGSSPSAIGGSAPEQRGHLTRHHLTKRLKNIEGSFDGGLAGLEKLLQANGGGSLAADNLVPAPSTVKATATENEQDDQDDQKCSAIHGSLLAETKPKQLSGSAGLVVNPDEEEGVPRRFRKTLRSDVVARPM
jgi:hypothetical protein